MKTPLEILKAQYDKMIADNPGKPYVPWEELVKKPSIKYQCEAIEAYAAQKQAVIDEEAMIDAILSLSFKHEEGILLHTVEDAKKIISSIRPYFPQCPIFSRDGEII